MRDRKIPESWFRATVRQTTMDYLTPRSVPLRPLAAGERRIGWLILPPFQRPPVWTMEQKVRFVESCWMGLPIGAFVYNRTHDSYDGPLDNWLLDGQQRVTAVTEYMADAFPVFGSLFSELTEVDHRIWGMATSFPCLETNLTSEAACLDVYLRLAYGGTPHEPRGSE